MSAVNLVYIYSDMVGFNLQAAIVNKHSVGRQSSRYLFR